MGCFLVPATEAVVTTIAEKVIKSKEKKDVDKVSISEEVIEKPAKIKFSTKLGWLNKLLWGGSALLAFEHLWHGEISPSFPFLTAVKTGETADMLAEMGSAGVVMAVLVTAVWGCMVAVSSLIEKRAVRKPETADEEA